MPELFQSFNSFLNIILRKKNAVVVGPHKQLVGEFPEDVTFQRYYEYYAGWDQIKRSIDTQHQKFMGSGIKITSNNEKFDKFVKEWWEITNAEKKFSDFFLSTFITGNGIMERQYTDEGKIGNIEHIPMTTIFKIFRDSWGNEIKLQQIVDGVFMDLDPKYYIHWTINNPDRQAFGKSEFHTLAAPRRITQKVDPSSGQAINPDRTMTSLLDAQAKLQNAEVEIKDKMSKPRIFASFPGMPQDQLAKLEGELSDQNTDKFIWAFNKEASMAEANISGATKFDRYGENIDQHIDLGTGFGSKVVTNPGSFGYASTQSTIDVLDQRMMSLQAVASELIKDSLLRPLAETWGFKDFDDYDVQIMFVPTVRRLTMEEVIQLPDVAVSPDEKRSLLKDLQIPLDDTSFSEFQKKQQAQQQETPKLPAQANVPHDIIDNFPRPEAEDQIPRPIRNNVSKDYEKIDLVEAVLSNPSRFDDYVARLVEKKIQERMEAPPNRDPDFGDEEPVDLYSIRPTQGNPSVTDSEISKRITGKNTKNTVAQPYTPANTIEPDGDNTVKYNHVSRSSTKKKKTETINMPPDNTRPTLVKKTKHKKRKT